MEKGGTNSEMIISKRVLDLIVTRMYRVKRECGCHLEIDGQLASNSAPKWLHQEWQIEEWAEGITRSRYPCVWYGLSALAKCDGCKASLSRHTTCWVLCPRLVKD